MSLIKAFPEEYQAWRNMRERCFNSNHPRFHRYGGRGITIASRWNDFNQFLSDVGPRPSPKHSLDRYPNNDGNYEPGNVRWATAKEQMRNTSANVRKALLEYRAKQVGVRPSTVKGRIKRGIPAERSFYPPSERVVLPLEVLAEKYEIDLRLVKRRMARGFTQTQALLLPSSSRIYSPEQLGKREWRLLLKERRAFFRMGKIERIVRSARRLVNLA